ncbi:PAS domain-containing sensor histidine kinase [Phenylobacterium sp.]|uniref:hybrid sensor histidine kinase/response regulator n=1 Tax=Phenylobacterium sp. TaxID=1871053 RepID=UPI0027279FE3|nr:PAS domain-containing sensor histidine kinase [Phenylobacterium sp.]MDO8379823.1 PAS domain S-box protein [Phenylobacterium sp.]
MIGRWAQHFAVAIERPVVGYAAALGAVAAAALLRGLAGLFMAAPPNYVAFFPAVLFATLVAGLRGGLLATALSAGLIWALWLPKAALGETWGQQHVQLLLFVLTATLTVVIAKALRLAVQRGATVEARFRIFQEQALDGFVIMAPVRRDGEVVDFLWTYANPAAEQMARAGLTGRQVTDVFAGEAASEVIGRLSAALEADRPDDMEVRRVIDGAERWMRSSAMRLGDGLAVSFHDITDQRRAEEAARRSRDEFEHIANAAPVLIWMSGIEQGAIWFNASWLAFTGRTLAEELDRGWLEGVHPEDRDRVLEIYQENFTRRSPARLEYRVRRHDGVYRWLDEAAAPRFDRAGTFLGYIGSCSDITDRKAAETALRGGEARVRALVDSLPQLLWASRPDGAFDYLSPQWVAFTGAPAADHMGDGWLQVIHPEDRDDLQAAWAQAVRGGLPFDVEHRIRRHDGVWRWFNGRASAIREEDGRVRRWFGSSSDITEIVEARRHLEERVAERTRELEASLEERARAEAALAQAHRLETVGRLTGGVAHDFNNLLTVVIGGLDMILKNPADTARVIRLSEAALAAGRRGERLTRQLLAFSRRQELKLEVVDVGALIEQVEPLVRRAVGEAIDLTVRCDPQVGATRLDSAQFEAALLNLVVNAADAVGGAGRIEILTRRVSLAAGDIPGAQAGDHVAVSVADTGGGMSPEVLARAFEPFFTTKEVGKGTGLGLAQVYGFITQCGGAATLDSRPGEGATVTLYVPAVDAVPTVEAPPEPGDDSWARGRVILLVEDDAAVRAVTEGLLVELGCKVTAEPDGPSALARLQSGEAFDLLISDIIMPGGMSGVDLAKLARARDPDLPIVLTTGYAGDEFEGASEVAWPVVRKPFRAEQLSAAVREALARVAASA